MRTRTERDSYLFGIDGLDHSTGLDGFSVDDNRVRILLIRLERLPPGL
jgi:hypothetical protein